jgi:hypothetical protein
MRNRISLGYLLLVAIHGFATSAGAADSDAFTLTITPYAWFAGVTGSVGVAGADSHVDASFLDILDQTDSIIGLFGRAEVRRGRLGGFVDGGYMRLGIDNIATRLGNVDERFEMALVDFGLLYRVGQWPSDGGRPSLALEALVGGRYVHLSNTFDFDFLGSRTQTKDWVDPIVGGQARVDLSDRWGLLLRGDVGGFGAASDLTWSAAGLVSYQFNLGRVQSEIFAGYKAIGEDYSSGSGLRKFTWDTVLHGPLIGMSFTF